MDNPVAYILIVLIVYHDRGTVVPQQVSPDLINYFPLSIFAQEIRSYPRATRAGVERSSGKRFPFFCSRDGGRIGENNAEVGYRIQNPPSPFALALAAVAAMAPSLPFFFALIPLRLLSRLVACRALLFCAVLALRLPSAAVRFSWKSLMRS